MSSVSTASTVERLKTAIDLARQGNKSEARVLLADICRVDPGSEKAWLWRASLAETSDGAIEYLQRVLEIDPSHATAGTWMQKLRQDRPRPMQPRPAGVPEPKVNCPFCLYQSSADFPHCPDCGAVAYLDIAAIEARDAVNVRYLQQAVEHYLAGLAARSARRNLDAGDAWNDFVSHYYLATAYLNLRQSDNALRHLRLARELQPGDQTVEQVMHQILLRKVILVVDDCATLRVLVAGTLERKGFRVIHGENGLDVMRALEQALPHLILLDVNMPLLDGYQTCKKLKSQPRTKSIPVVMLSGNYGFADRMRGKMAGASDYLSKPFNASAVVEVIRRHLGS